MTIDLDVVVNEEQLLDFALSHVCEREVEDVHYAADAIVIRYIINNFRENGIENFTEEDVDNRYSELIAEHVLQGLVEKGFIDVDFSENGEIKYSLTSKGKGKIKNGS